MGSQRVRHNWVTNTFTFLFGRKDMTKQDRILKSKDITLLTKVCSQSYGFSSNHVCIWELDHEKDWVLKNWCFGIVLLGKSLGNPLTSKEIKPVSPKGNQPWIVIGRIGAEAEALILWLPDVKSWVIGKDPDAGKEWRQNEKWVAGDKMVR